MVKLAIEDSRLRKDKIIAKMLQDLNLISQLIKTQDFTRLELPSPQDLAARLKELFGLRLKIGKKVDSEQAKRLLRRYLFLIERHISDLYPAAHNSLAELTILRKAIQDISNVIGKIPYLKSQPILPEQVFLPTEMLQTKLKWQKQFCANPRRGTAASRQEVHFIQRGNTISVRSELEQRAVEHKINYIDIGNGRLFLNLIDFDYYHLGLMHADHLQPSVSLIERLKEMIVAMNDDPGFRQEMETSTFNDGYFLALPTGEVVGSYWLYMAYHNSMQNLWFLLASDNAGNGKLAADPIEWLQSLEVGREYIHHLTVQGKNIDTDDILYKISDDVPLKEAFTQWVKESKKDIIKTCRSLAQFEQTLREKVMASSDRNHLRKMRLDLYLIKDRFFRLPSPGDSDSSSFPNLSSDDSEAFDQAVVERLGKNQVYMERERQQAKTRKETIKVLKQEKKRKHSTDEQENVGDSIPAKKNELL